MKRIWINKASSFKEAEKFDVDYYLGMSEAERLETLQLLREAYKIRKGHKGESRKGLRRLIKIIQQK
jgi:hypothetical protein